MTEEEKKAAETAEAKKQEADAEFEASLEGLSDEEKAEKIAEKEALENPDNKIDFKAQAEKERNARIAAEKALAQRRFEDSKRKKELGITKEDDEDDEEKPLTPRQLQKVLEERDQKTERRLMGAQIQEIARDLADSEDEAELIVEIHNNRTFPSHLSIREQLEEAHAIANRKKLVSKNSELKRALRSKETASNDAATTHRDPQVGTAPKLSESDKASYKRAGFVYDATARIWKKKLPTGKYLCKDPRTKKTWLLK